MNLDIGCDELGPGVLGYSMDHPEYGGTYYPIVTAAKPGNGDVGRFLDALPSDKRIVFPNVISTKLAGMLERRGFTLIHEWAEQWGENVPVWERKP